MGMFSWNCKVCGHPLLAPFNTDKTNRWMSRGVALTRGGSVLKGEYDGYGRLGGHEIHGDGEPEAYHHKCWCLAGKPAEFTSESEHARDQGHFFEEGEHTFPEPATKEEAVSIRRKVRHSILDE